MRPDKDTFFMNIAMEVSTRATCDRKHVGAVLVKDGNIISTGYNGSADGMEHCDDVGHMMVDGHCVRTIHAEANAILQVGVRVSPGATLYTTASPCWPCFQIIMRGKIKRIVFREVYRDERIFEFAEKAGIVLTHMEYHGTPKETPPTDR